MGKELASRIGIINAGICGRDLQGGEIADTLGGAKDKFPNGYLYIILYFFYSKMEIRPRLSLLHSVREKELIDSGFHPDL